MSTNLIDFSKGLDFSPLENLGVPKEDGVKFIAALSPLIDHDLQTKIQTAFTEDEMAKIGEEAESKGLKPEDGTFFLEEKYHEKTGRYFMEEMRLLFNEYIKHSANIISGARADAQSFVDSGDKNNKKFEDLIKNKNYEQAAEFFDQTLKTSKAD